MHHSKQSATKRIDLVDCLRGFAIIWIILLHFTEQFNLAGIVEHSYADDQALQWVRFFNANKIFAIFALLFGFSSYIQYYNQRKCGRDLRLRFAWRMVLLLFFGIVNMSVYSGDFLCTFAFLGLLLIPFLRCNNKIIYAVAFVLFLQPLEIIDLIKNLSGQDTEQLSAHFMSHFLAMQDAWTHGTFADVCRCNLENGFWVKVGRVVDTGRLTKCFLMMLTGVIMCKKRLFLDEGNNIGFWKKVLCVSIAAFVTIWILKRFVLMPMEHTFVRRTLLTIILVWYELCFTMIYVSAIVLLYYRTRLHRAISHIRFLGKMSLTCYLLQSIAGAFLFYNWGLGLYCTTSYASSFLLGILFLLLLHIFCRYWAQRHRRGPMEELWHKCMWIDKIRA